MMHELLCRLGIHVPMHLKTEYFGRDSESHNMRRVCFHKWIEYHNA